MLYMVSDPIHLGQDFWQQAWPVLSLERQKKVRRYSFECDKVLSAVAFVLLRFGLWHEYGYSAMPQYTQDIGGKPFLTTPSMPYFSLSHCPQAVVCAVDTAPLGVDVEVWNNFTPALLGQPMRDRIFSLAEQEALQHAPCYAQAACTLWVAKESVCKYTGEGIGDDMPFLLYRQDIHVDEYSFAEQQISVAVCRHIAHASVALPCQQVTSAMLQHFIWHIGNTL